MKIGRGDGMPWRGREGRADIEVFRLFSSRQNKAKQCLRLKQFGEAVAKL